MSHGPAIARTSTPRFLAQFGNYDGDAVRAVLEDQGFAARDLRDEHLMGVDNALSRLTTERQDLGDAPGPANPGDKIGNYILDYPETPDVPPGPGVMAFCYG